VLYAIHLQIDYLTRKAGPRREAGLDEFTGGP